MMTLLFTFILGAAPSSSAETLSAIRENNSGVSLLEKEKAFEAEKTFLAALAEDPFNLTLHYNLANAYLVEKKYEAALKEYEAILRRQDLPKELGFAAHFNAAVAAAENKNVDLALKHYQGALDLNPTSKEAKTNIELLTNSQGGGGGKGENKDDKAQDQDGKDPNGGQKNGDKSKDKPEKPVSEQDMKNILEELGRQEQRIRSLEYGNKKGAEQQPSKDW